METATQPLIESLERLLTLVENRKVDTLRWETSLMMFDFAVNRTELREAHKGQLDRFVEYVSDNLDTTRVHLLIGRASQTGPERNNESLAFDRAQTVQAYLRNANLPESMIGNVVSRGSKLPIVNVPGREDMLNRSVEIIYEWQIKIIDPPSISSGGTRTSLWNINFDVTLGGDLPIPGIPLVGIGAQLLIGRLSKRGANPESRTVYVYLMGKTLGTGLPIEASASVGIDNAQCNGDFETLEPVDWDWFELRNITLSEYTAAVPMGGLSLTTMMLPGHEVKACTIDYPVGFIATVGASEMGGFLNVQNN